MTEISALELFVIVLSGLFFYLFFMIVQTNWNMKHRMYNEKIIAENKPVEKKAVYQSRLVILRKEEKEEVLAGRMLTGYSLDTSEVNPKEKEEEIILEKIVI
jgi:hypothetical protein